MRGEGLGAGVLGVAPARGYQAMPKPVAWWGGGNGSSRPCSTKGAALPGPHLPPPVMVLAPGSPGSAGPGAARCPHCATRHHVAAVCTGKTERPMVMALPHHWEKGGCDPQMGGGSCQRWGWRKKEPVLPAGGAGNRGSPCRSSTGHGAGDGEGCRAACMAGQPDPMHESPPEPTEAPPQPVTPQLCQKQPPAGVTTAALCKEATLLRQRPGECCRSGVGGQDTGGGHAQWGLPRAAASNEGEPAACRTPAVVSHTGTALNSPPHTPQPLGPVLHHANVCPTVQGEQNQVVFSPNQQHPSR